MLEQWTKPRKPENDELEGRLLAAGKDMESLCRRIKEKKLPILVVLDGWGAAGKGSVLKRVIKDLDPRFFNVSTMEKCTEEEKRRPFLYRYFTKIPKEGKIMFMDGGWMDSVTRQYLGGEIDDTSYAKRIESINRFERQLTDNGYLLVKFFFHIGEGEQQKRLDGLLSDKNTRWRVSDWDCWQNKHYDKCLKLYDEYMIATDHANAPWTIIDAKNQKWALLQVLETITAMADRALSQGVAQTTVSNHFPLVSMPKLANISLDKSLDDKEYGEELEKCQKRLSELHNELYRKKVPVIIAYEGWDAAGKGGNIKRITAALDPRGYEVHPIASPEPNEKARHYLWRFYERLPKTGHIAIFDRTWYGRVMVERIEGFCSEDDWKRAYNEINEFEKELHDWGAVIIKFWVQIDKDTQLERFNDRQNTPEKQWKITDEDWRNREKWDEYEKAIDEMLQKTSTSYAPWYILESKDKKYARIKALKRVIKEIEKAL